MLKKLGKKGQTGIGQLPQFFQIMLMVIIFAGLTFIVLDKFILIGYDKGTSVSVINESISPSMSGVNLSVHNLRDVTCIAPTKILNTTNSYDIAVANITLTKCQISNSSQVGCAGCTKPWLVTYSYTWSADTSASDAINTSTHDLYDYGIGFLGIIILVVMVYLIISIVSGKKGGAR